MNREELDEILRLHKLWLNGDSDGFRTDLSYANLRDANLSYANLRDANLSYANLRDVDLRDADLRDADLSYANLRDADLRDADLRDVDLNGTNLSYANLRDADLRDADLKYCIGNGREIKSLQIGTYLIAYHNQKVSIGCQTHELSEWLSFTDEQINRMDSEALAWWKLNKDIIKILVEREAAK